MEFVKYVPMLLSIPFGAIFAVEFVLMKKGNGKIITIVITALAGIITFFSQNLILKEPAEKAVFFMIFLLFFIIIVYSIYHFSYKKLINSKIHIEDMKYNNFISYLDLGNQLFKEEMIKCERRYEQSEFELMKKEHENLKKFTESMSNELTELFYNIIDLIKYEEGENRDNALIRLLGFACFSFLPLISSTTDSRLTVRKYNKRTKAMENVVSTNTPNKAPSPIYLNKRGNNMIVRSMNAKCPVFYSSNKIYHQSTSINSIEQGKYDDYISYCLIVTSNGKHERPNYSICLEFKKYYSEKMKSLVYSQSFSLFCRLLIECINKFDKTEEVGYENS